MDRQKVTTPNDNDVIKGRGNGANFHPGNIRFRELVKAERVGYALSSKADKKRYAKNIVQHISSLDPPGRFLDKDEEGQWFVMEDKQSKDKTRQALREGAPAIVEAHNEQMLVEQSKPLFLDIHVATNNTSDNPKGMNDTDTMAPIRSIDNATRVPPYMDKSISSSCAITNQTSACHLHGSDTGPRSGIGKCENDADSLSDCSLADYGYDKLEQSDEKKPAAKDGK